MTGVPKKRAYVKFVSMLSGTTDLYFATGALTSAPANCYNLLELDGLGKGEANCNPLTGATQFAGFAFKIIDSAIHSDGAAFVSTSLGQAAYLIYSNKAYLDGCRVQVYEGYEGLAYSSFTRVYDGHLNTWSRIEGGFQFEVMPFLKKLERPIDFPTGSFQLIDAISETATKSIKIKNGMNVNPGSRTNLLGGSTAWTVTAGSISGSPGATGINNTSGGLSDFYTDISLGSGATDVKYGTSYTFYCKHSGFLTGGGDTVQLIAELYNGASLLETVTGEVDTTTAAVGGDYTGIVAQIKNPLTTKIRFRVKSNDGTTLGPTVMDFYVVVSRLWQFGREFLDIIVYSNTGTNTLVKVAGRGMLGSNPTAHDADEEAILVTSIAGHPLDIFRRLALTTTSAGSNGAYDAGDGYGLGSEVAAAYIDSTTFDSERDATDAGSAFSGHNFAAYQMQFFFAEKIPNFLEFSFNELFRPIHANLLTGPTGLIYPHIWRAAETVGSSAFTDATIVLSDGASELVPEYDAENAINRVVCRYDYDQLGAVDIKGNQSGGRNNYLREYTPDEATCGEDSTTASSKARLGVREAVIESQGLRGSHWRRFGYGNDLGGDQTMFEVARRIITRHRWPLPVVEELAGTWSTRAIEVGEIAALTFANTLDLKNGAWGRTAHKVAVEGKQGPSYAGEEAISIFKVRIVEDVVAIPNTTTSGAPTAPVDADFTSVRARKNLTEAEKDNMPFYPKGRGNIAWVTMAAAKTHDRKVYAWSSSTAGAAYPGDGSLQLVGILPAGETEFYFCVPGSGEAYVKLSAVSADRVESALNATAQRCQYWTGAAWANGTGAYFAYQKNRGPKAEINQLNGAGERITVQTQPFNR